MTLKIYACAVALTAAASSASAQTMIDKSGQRPEYGVEATATAGDPMWEQYSYKVEQVRYLVNQDSMEKSWPGWRTSVPAGTRLRVVPYRSGVKACSADGTSHNTWFAGSTLPSCAYDDDADGTFDRLSTMGGSPLPSPR